MVFRFHWYIAILLPLFFAAIAGFGIYWYKTHDKLRGCLIMGIGILFLFLAGPSMFLDQVILTDESIFQRTGFWFEPNVKGFKYKDIEKVIIENGYESGIRNDLWHVYYKSGKDAVIDPGDLWANNCDKIIPFLREKGVIIEEK